MNIFKNKFFLLGNLAFLLIAIPIALFFIKNQTSTRGSAAPTTTLSFIGSSLTPDQCDTTQKSRLVLNPGQNVVDQVTLAFKWDKTKFDVEFTPNSTAFPQVIDGPTETASGRIITLSISGDVTKAITTTTDVGTITIKPLAPTTGTVNFELDPAETKVKSLSESDGNTENVYNPSGSRPLEVSIVAKSCTSTTPSPTGTSINPSPTGSTTTIPTATTAPVATPTTAVVNISPICIDLAASTSSGSAPLAVNFTANGRDNDGTLTKATFNFGNGTQQDITAGLGAASGSAVVSHTYTNGGTFTATSVFTDNRGAVSTLCSKQISVSGAFATTAPAAPTATPTLAPIATSIPTATPTLAPSGSIGVTVSIIGGILLVVVAGIFLLAL